MSIKIPNGKDFRPVFVAFIIIIVVLLLFCVAYFMMASDPRGRKYEVSKTKDNSDSSLSSSAIDANLATPVSRNLLSQNNQFISTGMDGRHVPVAGDLILKNGKLFELGEDGKLHAVNKPPTEGLVAYQNGQKMKYHDGRWVPVTETPAKAGELVMKDGKLYRVGKDGELTPFDGSLADVKDGEVVWKNGQKYMVENGELIPFKSNHLADDTLTGAQPGDLVMKDGKLYEIGADGKKKLFHGKPKTGQIIWKDGKAYRVDKDGKLQAVKNGEYRTIKNKPYVYENGKWVPLSAKGMKIGDLVEKEGQYYQVGPDGELHAYKGKLQSGQVVWKDGKPYIVDENGKLRALKDGEKFTGSDGKQYTYQSGRVVETSDSQKDETVARLSPSELEEAEKALLKAYASEILLANSNETVIPGNKNAKDTGTASQVALKGSPQTLAAMNSSLMAPDEYSQTNNQAGKKAFLDGDHSAEKPLPLDEIKPLTPYTVIAGTILPATLVTGMNSDLPGNIQARISQNVYDTKTGNYLLIPQGSVLNGTYDSNVSYGQERVMMVWQSITFPNGNTVNLDGMPGADLQGYAGIKDQVDNHYGKVFGSAVLFSLFGVASQMTQPDNNDEGTSNQQIVYASVGTTLTQTAQAYLQKNLNIQPTLKIRPGANFQVYVTRNLSLRGAYQFN